MYSLITISFLCAITTQVRSLVCSYCTSSQVECNDKHCFVLDCYDTTNCDGTCVLGIAKFSNGSMAADASCLFELNNIELLYSSDELGPTCKQVQEPLFIEEDNVTTISCICQSDVCNSNITLPESTNYAEEESGVDVTMTIVLGVVVGVVILTVILLIWWQIRVRRRRMLAEEEKKAMAGAGQNRFSADSSSLLDGGWDEIGKHSCSTYKYSSSMSSHYSRGSKGNALNQNDQHLPIDLDKIIGRGRFAEVWKAKLQQESQTSKVVSVKVFRLPNYGAWRQEREILSERWMRHDNIIEYYSSEQHSCRGRLQYWLITAYYAKGNLQEFLRNNALKWNEFCDMAASIARGLSYLHDEHDLEGKEKYPVAHRDVKSCNILVKDDGVTCVLADFGLSLKLDPSLSRDELANAGQVGTSRYMAPELLERLVNLEDIEMFKRVDMYAFSLVMWELVSRCDIVEGMLRPYQPPFGDRINDYPTKEQILLLVCRSKEKPEIRSEWRSHKGMSKFIDTMTECWDSEPEARLTASCVLERILALRAHDDGKVAVSPKVVEAKEALADNEVNEITELISTVV